MGYEVACGWGAAMPDPARDTIVMVGEGSYMMMNSDINSTVLSGPKMIVIICDNGGFAVINCLQNFTGVPSFNTLIKDSRVHAPLSINFARHVESLADLDDALVWA